MAMTKSNGNNKVKKIPNLVKIEFNVNKKTLF